MPDDSKELLDYLARLRRLTAHVDPTAASPGAEAIRDAGVSLDALATIDLDSLTAWVAARPRDVNGLGLAVGLSQEKLHNLLRSRFGTSSWAKAATDDPAGLVAWLEDEFAILDALTQQRNRAYGFGDILAARGTSRQTASSAGEAGRLIENAVEGIVKDLGLPYAMRGRFVGRNGETGPADLVVPNFTAALITVACKGFDSTGSKLTAAVSEVTEMANVRFAHQYVFAVVDGIGWLRRMGDFRRMYALSGSRRIDGLYALADLDQFRTDLETATRRHDLLP
ncbi:MAG TPA: hypothetical protein VLJ59_20610 [Mycobacteriales bacterium]|nr:hypothetical protein [Mycobacteriales bacterium]